MITLSCEEVKSYIINLHTSFDLYQKRINIMYPLNLISLKHGLKGVRSLDF